MSRIYAGRWGYLSSLKTVIVSREPQSKGLKALRALEKSSTGSLVFTRPYCVAPPVVLDLINDERKDFIMDYELNLTEAEAAHAAEMREMLEASELGLSDRDYIDAINIDAAHGIWFND